MKLSQIYRKAADILEDEDRKFGMRTFFCCHAILEAQNTPYYYSCETIAQKVFHKYFKPSYSLKNEPYFGPASNRQDRILALTLLAEIMENEGK